MTSGEYQYMLDLKGLDDIHLGMRAPSMAVRHAPFVAQRVIRRGWVRYEPDEAGGFVTLSTRGLRALQREVGRRARQLLTGDRT
jgi:hypothetical protein